MIDNKPPGKKETVTTTADKKEKTLDPSKRISITEVGTNMPEVRFEDLYVGGFV